MRSMAKRVPIFLLLAACGERTDAEAPRAEHLPQADEDQIATQTGPPEEVPDVKLQHPVALD